LTSDRAYLDFGLASWPSNMLNLCQSRAGVFQEIGPACQFLLLPVINGHIFGSAREVVPKILHELELFGWAQVKDGWLARIHRVPTANCVKSGDVWAP